jgi:hypothetical protein
MTDYSVWTDEQVNEAIAIKRGWVCYQPINTWFNQETGEYSQGNAIDYAHSWELCGELLEEMKASRLLREDDGSWCCIFECAEYPTDETISIAVFAPTPQRAICEAWLAWKEQG